MTVTGRLTVWLKAPLVAVTVTEVDIGVDPPPPDPPLLPQAAMQPMPTIAVAISRYLRIERRRKTNAQSKPASAAAGGQGFWAGCLAATELLAERVSCVVAVAPEARVTVAGLKLHVTPAVGLEHVNETVELSPP